MQIHILGAHVTSQSLPHAQIQVAYAKDQLRPDIEVLCHKIILDQQRLGLAVVGYVGAGGVCARQKETLERHAGRILQMGQPIGLNLEAVNGQQLGAIVAGHIVRQALALWIPGRRLLLFGGSIPAARKVQLAQLNGRQALARPIAYAVDAQLRLKVRHGRILPIDAHPFGRRKAVGSPVDLQAGLGQRFARQRNGQEYRTAGCAAGLACRSAYLDAPGRALAHSPASGATSRWHCSKNKPIFHIPPIKLTLNFLLSTLAC